MRTINNAQSRPAIPAPVGSTGRTLRNDRDTARQWTPEELAPEMARDSELPAAVLRMETGSWIGDDAPGPKVVETGLTSIKRIEFIFGMDQAQWGGYAVVIKTDTMADGKAAHLDAKNLTSNLNGTISEEGLDLTIDGGNVVIGAVAAQGYFNFAPNPIHWVAWGY